MTIGQTFDQYSHICLMHAGLATSQILTSSNIVVLSIDLLVP